VEKNRFDTDPRREVLRLIGHVRSYVLYRKSLGCETLPRSKVSPPTLIAIREELGECHRCQLSATRKNIVFGEGDEKARLVFVGEGPGYDEDAIGRPFVGKAGQLLTRIIAAIGMRRDEVYITNVVKCRPPQNRTPWPNEIARCYPFLVRQLRAIHPAVICALGNTPAQTLLGTDAGITTLRGTFRLWEGIKVMPTFHPAYLLRNPERKKETWNDMKAIQKELASES
jgi:uracil-DNA glycosylase family 4